MGCVCVESGEWKRWRMDVNCGYVGTVKSLLSRPLHTVHYLGHTRLISCIWLSGRAGQGRVTCVNSLLQCLHSLHPVASPPTGSSC